MMHHAGVGSAPPPYPDTLSHQQYPEQPKPFPMYPPVPPEQNIQMNAYPSAPPMHFSQPPAYHPGGQPQFVVCDVPRVPLQPIIINHTPPPTTTIVVRRTTGVCPRCGVGALERKRSKSKAVLLTTLCVLTLPLAGAGLLFLCCCCCPCMYYARCKNCGSKFRCK